MASEVELCNMALSNIRSSGINSLSESSLQAQQCKLKYATVRDMVLADADWGFNSVLAPLAVLSGVSIFNFLYAYQRPVDCLYINRLVLNYPYYSSGISTPLQNLGVISPDLDKQVAYREFNSNGVRVIASNEASLYIDYRARVTDPNLFNTAFMIALSWLLAAAVAIPIVGAEQGRALRADALNLYKSYVAAAAASAMSQRYTAPRDSEFITARY